MRAFVTSPMGIASLLAAALAAIYVVMAYGSYLVVLAPFAMMLVCPLMMLFMMGGHNHGSDAGMDHHSTHAGCHSMAATGREQDAPGQQTVPAGDGSDGRNSD